MTAILAREKQLLLRGNDTVAFVADDVIQAVDASLTPVAGEQVSRELEQSFFGSQEQLLVNRHQQCSFGMEFAADGEADDEQPWDRALRACGFSVARISTAGLERSVYRPVSAGFTRCRVGYRMGSRLHDLRGCLGNMQLEIAANAIPRFTFEMTGTWTDPTVAAPLTGNFAGHPAPQEATDLNTPTFSFGGLTDLPLMKFGLNMGNAVIHRSPINKDAEAIITDRQPTAEITVDDVAARNHFLDAVNNAAAARKQVIVTHGKTGGRQIQAVLPVARINPGIAYADDNGVSQITIPLQVLPGDAGNMDVTITIT